MTSREFNQDVSRAKRAAQDGPVVITDRGEPAWVLLSHDAWKHVTGEGLNLVDLLAMPESDHIEIDFPRPRMTVHPADLD